MIIFYVVCTQFVSSETWGKYVEESSNQNWCHIGKFSTSTSEQDLSNS